MKRADDRDRAIEQLLEGGKGRADPLRHRRDDTSCLDAETLAAWADGALGPVERTAAEAHAAGCARCQAMLAAMMRAIPDPAVAHRLSTSDHRSSTRRVWVSWLVPLTAAAAALVIWIAVPGQRQQAPADTFASRAGDIAQTASSIAPPAPQSPAAKAVPPPDVPAVPAARRADTPVGRDREEPKEKKEAFVDRGYAAPTGTRAEVPQSKADAVGRSNADDRRALAKERGTELDARKAAPASVAAASPVIAGAPQPPPPPEPAAAPRPVQTQAPPPVTQQLQAPSQQQAQTSTPTRAAGVTGGAAGGRGGARVAAPPASVEEAVVLNREVAGIDVISPDAASRWRVFRGTTDRAIQRSTDGGATWTAQTIDAPASLTAGSAPSRDVCWFVGRGGAALISIDGRTWRRVAFPVAVDLLTIRATDARNATVTTADGRTFVTSDGGATWTPR